MVRKDVIKVLLENHPHLREDYDVLITHIWEQQALELGITAASDIFNAIRNKQLWHADTIVRAARGLRREYPHLRPSEETQERNAIYEQIMRARGGEIE